ncbi:UNVERIFIED_CONTAM: hypothetical protein HDU68_001144 [Siphonaria sp. JEL0065]|nr:hypothetical protein HDU68_001144 [Siphonaria sp. JEL0065]
MAIIEEIPERKVHIVTGSNTGIGLSIANRLVALSISSKTPSLIVLACRNPTKASAAKKELVESAIKQFGKKLVDEWVEVGVVQVNLSDAKQVLEAAKEIKERFTRIDSLIFNAGMLPVHHVAYWHAIKAAIKNPSQFSKIAGGEAIVQRVGDVTKDAFQFGETFAANFLGHYILLRELESVLEGTARLIKGEKGGLSGSGSIKEDGPRVVWTTSDTADRELFDESDPQCLKGASPYESSKRLIELIHSETAGDLKRKGIYSVLSNPGISATEMSGAPILLTMIFLYILRFFGLAGVCISPWNASRASAYAAMEVKNASELSVDTVYQSDVSIWGESRIRMLKFKKDGIKECNGDVCSLGVDVKVLRREMDELVERVRKASL